jgi:apolipoprotein N-acyltransferase
MDWRSKFGIGVGLSAVLYWFGTGLSPIWFCTWLAPVPILFVVAELPSKAVWWAAFLAWAVGGLNNLHYMTTQLGAPPALLILSIVGPALVFAALVRGWCRRITRGQPIWGGLVLASGWVVYEFISQVLSVHSNLEALGYSQFGAVLVLQLASLGGVMLISFTLMLLPAWLVGAVHSSRQRAGSLVGVGLGLAIIAVWGFARLSGPKGRVVAVGLTSTDSRLKSAEVLEGYRAAAVTLRQEGAALVLGPEKTLRCDVSGLPMADRTEEQARVPLVLGFEVWSPDSKRNEARVYGGDGQPVGIYFKHHMLPPFESNLKPGTDYLTTRMGGALVGVGICKDMTFPEMGRAYGKRGIELLLVPGVDFDEDGVYMARVAIFRGVENGYAVARCARFGHLVLADSRGRVYGEAVSAKHGFAKLLAEVPVGSGRTPYRALGDWLGWACVAIFGWGRFGERFWPGRAA